MGHRPDKRENKGSNESEGEVESKPKGRRDRKEKKKSKKLKTIVTAIENEKKISISNDKLIVYSMVPVWLTGWCSPF